MYFPQYTHFSTYPFTNLTHIPILTHSILTLSIPNIPIINPSFHTHSILISYFPLSYPTYPAILLISDPYYPHSHLIPTHIITKILIIFHSHISYPSPYTPHTFSLILFLPQIQHPKFSPHYSYPIFPFHTPINIPQIPAYSDPTQYLNFPLIYPIQISSHLHY